MSVIALYRWGLPGAWVNHPKAVDTRQPHPFGNNSRGSVAHHRTHHAAQTPGQLFASLGDKTEFLVSPPTLRGLTIREGAAGGGGGPMGQRQCTDPSVRLTSRKNPTPVPSKGRFQASPVQTSPNPKAMKKIARLTHLAPPTPTEEGRSNLFHLLGVGALGPDKADPNRAKPGQTTGSHRASQRATHRPRPARRVYTGLTVPNWAKPFQTGPKRPKQGQTRPRPGQTGPDRARHQTAPGPGLGRFGPVGPVSWPSSLAQFPARLAQLSRLAQFPARLARFFGPVHRPISGLGGRGVCFV